MRKSGHSRVVIASVTLAIGTVFLACVLLYSLVSRDLRVADMGRYPDV